MKGKIVGGRYYLDGRSRLHRPGRRPKMRHHMRLCKHFIGLVVALLLAPAAGGQVVTLPAAVSGQPGIPIPITAACDGKNVTWMSPDPGLVVIDGSFFGGATTKALLFGPAGTYRLWAVTAKGDAVSPLAVCAVTIGTPPPPGPPDPLLAPLRAAYAADPDPQKAAMVPLLAKVFAYGAGAVPSNPTVGALNAAMMTYAKGLGVLPANIAAVQAVISTELLKYLPDPTATPTATYTAATATSQFNRIAALLNQLTQTRAK